MNKGYTLLELLIAMAITLFVTLAVTEFFISEHRIYTVQEAKAEMSQTLRGAMRMFTGELILAGYGLPPAIHGITRFERDEIEFRTNLRNVRAYLSFPASPGQNTLYVRDGAGPLFERGDHIILCNLSGECGEHTLSADGRSDSITLTSSLSAAFPSGTRIDLVNTVSYRHNRSRRDLQRKIDRGNWEAVAENVAEEGFLISYRNENNGTSVNASEIRSIEITLTVESLKGNESASSTVTLRNYF